MQVFEYDVVEYDEAHQRDERMSDVRWGAIADKLNAKAVDGWEVVSATPTEAETEDAFTRKLVVVWKRAIVQELEQG